MNNKSKLKVGSWSAAILLALKTYAWVLVVLAIIGIIVAGVIVYGLWKIATMLAPKETAVTNNLVQIITNNNDYSVKPLLQRFCETPSSVEPFTYTFQYGVSNVAGNHQPWMMPGSNLVSSVDGQPDYIISTTNEFNFSVTYGGYSYQYDVDGQGNEISETNYPPQSVVITRSADLVNWSPIATNLQRGMNTVTTFTDSNPPPGQAFYLVIPQSSPP
jgi:hypothetical protein